MKRLITSAALLGALGCLSWADRLVGTPGGPPEGTKPYAALPEYDAWWKQVEGCSGKTRPLVEIKWMAAPFYPFAYRGQTGLAGIYVAPRTIIMAELVAGDARMVRHEMLHAIENSDSHRTHHAACKDLVTP